MVVISSGCWYWEVVVVVVNETSACEEEKRREGRGRSVGFVYVQLTIGEVSLLPGVVSYSRDSLG